VAEVIEGEGPGKFGRFLGIESPGRFTVSGEFCDLIEGEFPAGAGVKGPLGTVGSSGQMGEFLFDFPAGAEAGVNHAEALEVGQGLAVGRKSVSLFPGWFLPLKTQPMEVIFDLLVEFRPDASVVDILESQQKTTLFCHGKAVGYQRREGVA